MSREISPLGLGTGIGIQPAWLVERAQSINERFFSLVVLLRFIERSDEAVFHLCGSISPS